MNNNLARAEARWRRQSAHLQRMAAAVPTVNQEGAAVQYTDVELDMLADAARSLCTAWNNLLDVAVCLKNRQKEEEEER